MEVFSNGSIFQWQYFCAMKCIVLRVEAAFHKFDTDGDGFIDWEEFKQVNFKDTKAAG